VTPAPPSTNGISRYAAWWLHPLTAAVAAVLVRAMLAWWWDTLAAPKPFETERLVSNWFAGHGYVYRFLGVDYRSFHSLVPYSLLYAALYGLGGGHPTANLVAQWAFAALLCVVVWHLGLRLGGPRVAGLAAWLAALHPGLVAYDATKLVQFSLDATLVAAVLLAFVRWAEAPSVARAACGGLLTGLLMYERGTMGLFFPVALLWVKRAGHLPWRPWTRQAALYGAVALLLLLPWFVRNAVVHERPVLMMTPTWFSLWKGNHEDATGTEFTTAGRPLNSARSSELAQRLEGTSEVEQMEGFRDAALTFIRTQPAAAAGLYVRKLTYFWWQSPHTGLQYPRRWTVVSQTWYLVFIGFAALGLVMLARAGPEPWAIARLILWLALCFSAGQAVFYIAGRHRWTIEPVLGLLTAAGLWWSSRGIIRLSSRAHTAR
jgi:4-amino-4-deoxy-L-arabinose transferase-like glycosyltransferase